MRAFGFALLSLVALFTTPLLLIGCGGGGAKPRTPQCQIASDCKNPLVCIQGYCVKACMESRDCTSPGRCIKADEGTTCQVPEKVTCSLNSQCTRPLVCGIDLQCRNECAEDFDCPSGQKCTTTSRLCADPERDKNYDPVTNELKLPSGTGGTSGGGGSGGSGAGEDAGAANDAGRTGGNSGTDGGGADGETACSTPQTLFGSIVQGDANPNFTSGVGVRSGNQFFIFSSYDAPSPDAGAAGAADAGATAGNAVYVQAFDVATGQSKGPAAPLFAVPDAGSWKVSDVSVAPSGEIALLYRRLLPGNTYALHASFMKMGAPDAGAAALQVQQTVLIESAPFQFEHVTWAAATGRFVFSWKYLTTGWFVRVRKFLPDGRGAGGDTNAVEAPTLDNRWDQGSVGTSGTLLGVATVANATYWPYLTILDNVGNRVRDSIQVSKQPLSNQVDWVTAGGIASGFVFLAHHTGSVQASFIPTTGAGSVISDGGAPADAANIVDGGDAGAPAAPVYTTFTFPSTASTAHMISDDTGGAGGVGAVLLEQNGASFLYVMPDGMTRMATGTVISSANGAAAAISNYRGSFVISLYDDVAHATQLVGTSCSP